MQELRQSKNYANYMEMINWDVDVVEGVYIFSKKIPIIGSVVKIQRTNKKISQEKLLEVRKNKRAFMINIEPLNKVNSSYYISAGFNLTHVSSLPSKTIRVNLVMPEKKLLSEMHYKTRYNTKIAIKRGVKVKTSKDIKLFAELWQKCAKERGMFLPLKREINAIYKAFGDEATIFLAYKGNDLLGGILTLGAGKICYYMYAASRKTGKKLFAPTLLAWEAIRFAKKKKYKYFDFEGVFDERYPIKTWKGFTRFKRSFGGKQIEFPLMLRKFFLPV